MATKKKPKSRPRAKGIARIKQRGEYGPSMAALEKTIRKLTGKTVTRLNRKLQPGITPESYVFLGKKRWRHDYRIAVSSALNAIGLDPKKPADKSLRAAVHTAMQRYSDLLYDAVRNPKTSRDPEVHYRLEQTLNGAIGLIVRSRKSQVVGVKDARHFFKVLVRHLNTIEIVHEELARRPTR